METENQPLPAWKDYTPEQIQKITEEKCTGCSYLTVDPNLSIGTFSFCNYLSVEGHSRGCRPEVCDKYSTKKIGKNYFGIRTLPVKEDE